MKPESASVRIIRIVHNIRTTVVIEKPRVVTTKDFHDGLGIPVNTATGEERRARELVVLPEERVTKGVDVIMRNWGMGLHRRRKGARP